ncbi:MAG: hypothetical protein NZ651_04315 [Candidatus Bipolaricaulota bacterium]|nr:hypothetical protein [Candidatus Bipolaricaulota bacterium]MDW8126975.1 hypothetical protein [Candidatus Bipolaricaulota bacterium]
MFILLVLFSALALGQTATLTAPWLTVYDPAGRPRWEIRMEKLVRTKEGWEGEGVSVTLFSAGAPLISVRAPRLSADPLGRNWSLSGGISGEGQGFSFSAEEARWMDRLILIAFSGQREDLKVEAQEARWELLGVIEFFSAKVTFSDWFLKFPYGKFVEAVLVAEDVEARGRGLRISADFLEFQVDKGRAKFLGAKVVRSS